MRPMVDLILKGHQRKRLTIIRIGNKDLSLMAPLDMQSILGLDLKVDVAVTTAVDGKGFI